MANRIAPIAIGACRRLGQYRSNAGRASMSTPSSSSSSSPSRHARTITSSHARIRPAAAASSYSSGDNASADVQRRGYHRTSIARNDASSSATTTSSKTGETIPAFASPRVEELFQKIIWLDMVEVHLLAELINEKMGITISDAERERMARGGGRGKGNADVDDAPAEPIVEKTTFDVKLMGFDAKNKIKVIKEVRSLTNLGLKEAKELVEGVPATLKKNIKKEEAEELKALLEGLGAQVEIV
jgi:large subunit ribosomal protein L7/L12